MSERRFAHSLMLSRLRSEGPKRAKSGGTAVSVFDGVAQKLKVSVTRRLRPGWAKRGKSAR